MKLLPFISVLSTAFRHFEEITLADQRVEGVIKGLPIRGKVIVENGAAATAFYAWKTYVNFSLDAKTWNSLSSKIASFVRAFVSQDMGGIVVTLIRDGYTTCCPNRGRLDNPIRKLGPAAKTVVLSYESTLFMIDYEPSWKRRKKFIDL